MDKKGKILIPGISEAVAPVTEEELELYDKIDFDMEEYTRDVGAETLLHGCKVPCLCPRVPYVPTVPCAGDRPLLWEGARGAGRDPGISVCREPSDGTDIEKQHLTGLEIRIRSFLKMSYVDF